jgi:hypothetical protein
VENEWAGSSLPSVPSTNAAVTVTSHVLKHLEHVQPAASSPGPALT